MKRRTSSLSCGTAILIGATLAAIGCSSSSDGSGGSSAGVTCETACTKADGLKCPNDDPHEVCVTTCEDTSNNYGDSCKSKYSAVLGCIVNKGTLVCGPDGKADVQENVTTLCRSEVQSFA